MLQLDIKPEYDILNLVVMNSIQRVIIMRKILLVVDMQNDFIEGSLKTEQAPKIIPNVVKKINDKENQLIIFTQDTHGEDYLEIQEGKKLPVEHCIENTHGWEINKDILNAWKNKQDRIILENRENNSIIKDTFGSKDLITVLKEINAESPIEEIEIAGLCTDICVISNALLIKAYFPEIEIVVDSACCAGVTPESHETALNAMKACQVTVI